MLAVVVLHVNVPEVLAVTDGPPLFWDTVVVVKLEQPFEGSVLVSVYVPGWLMTGVAVVPPDTMPGPDHT
jgi:hypothetical protein